jgi:hypothetical protein
MLSIHAFRCGYYAIVGNFIAALVIPYSRKLLFSHCQLAIIFYSRCNCPIIYYSNFNAPLVGCQLLCTVYSTVIAMLLSPLQCCDRLITNTVLVVFICHQVLLKYQCSFLPYSAAIITHLTLVPSVATSYLRHSASMIYLIPLASICCLLSKSKAGFTTMAL